MSVTAAPKLGFAVMILDVANPVGSAVYAQLMVAMAVEGVEIRGRVIEP